jgi:hypothetical protein
MMDKCLPRAKEPVQRMFQKKDPQEKKQNHSEPLFGGEMKQLHHSPTNVLDIQMRQNLRKEPSTG